MNILTQANLTQPRQLALTASRKPGMLEHGQLELVVFSILLGTAYIARALLAG